MKLKKDLIRTFSHLQALTLVRPPMDNLELDPLAVLHLNNGLFIHQFLQYFIPKQQWTLTSKHLYNNNNNKINCWTLVFNF